MVAREKLLPGPVAIERVTGERPHYSTFFRWTQVGVLAPSQRRVRLEFVKAGSRRLTSEDAVQRFFAALTTANYPAPTKAAASVLGPTSVDDAEAELRRHGI